MKLKKIARAACPLEAVKGIEREYGVKITLGHAGEAWATMTEIERARYLATLIRMAKKYAA